MHGIYEVTGEGPLPQEFKLARRTAWVRSWMKDVLWVCWGQAKGCASWGGDGGCGVKAPGKQGAGQQSSTRGKDGHELLPGTERRKHLDKSA